MVIIEDYHEKYRGEIIKLGSTLHKDYNFNINYLNKVEYVYCALLDNVVIGFIHFQQLIDHIDLIDIVVNEKYRRFKVGTLLMNIMFKRNLDIFLEVNIKNITAINFYKKFHFSEIGLRKKYYDNDDAIVMKRCYDE